VRVGYRVCAVDGADHAAPAAAAPKMTVTAYADLKWQPLDPKNPGGLQVSVINGDIFKGPTSFYLKLPAGMKANGSHAHTNGYYGIVIAGAPAHGLSEKDLGKGLAIGSTWFQPGKEQHYDACTGDTDCVILLNYPNGGFDYIPGPAPAAPAKK
jgi:hypothetical protein